MRLKLFALASLSLIAVPSFATVLWDQTGDFTNNSPDANSTYYPQAPEYSCFLESCVTVDSVWHISSLRTVVQRAYIGYYDSPAEVNISQGGGPAPTNDPTAGNLPVTANYTHITVPGDYSYWYMTVQVDITLQPGTYWIGMARESQDTGDYSWQHMYLGNPMHAQYGSYMRNPGGAFNYPTTAWMAATWSGDTLYADLQIQGTAQAVPEPGSLLVLGLGSVGVLLRRRRRAR